MGTEEMVAAAALVAVVLWVAFDTPRGKARSRVGRQAVDAFDQLRRDAAGTALEKAAAEAPDNPYLSGFGMAKKPPEGDGPKPPA